jgi:AmmeMemoRadiSam system protein B
MNTRRRCLPDGWYPRTRTDTIRRIESLSSSLSVRTRAARAGVLPHAGWDFSGKAALSVILSIAAPVDTCVVVGGHLPAGAGVFAAPEDAYETPLGPMTADHEFITELSGYISLQEDRSPDNTVEIQLPFLKYAFPDARAVWLRAAPSEEAPRLGQALHQAALRTGRRIVVLGSTDLTHYGPDYGFTPHGRGEKAQAWVRDVNDKKIIDALLELDTEGALAAAQHNSSACSAGGAVAAAAFARSGGTVRGELLAYYTSYDIFPRDSFVGYAAILYP